MDTFNPTRKDRMIAGAAVVAYLTLIAVLGFAVYLIIQSQSLVVWFGCSIGIPTATVAAILFISKVMGKNNDSQV